MWSVGTPLYQPGAASLFVSKLDPGFSGFSLLPILGHILVEVALCAITFMFGCSPAKVALCIMHHAHVRLNPAERPGSVRCHAAVRHSLHVLADQVTHLRAEATNMKSFFAFRWLMWLFACFAPGTPGWCWRWSYSASCPSPWSSTCGSSCIGGQCYLVTQVVLSYLGV